MKKIQLTGKHALGKFVVIDDMDYEEVSKSKWWFNGKYAVATRKRKNIYLHRLIVKALPGIVIEHINEDSLDCRRINLLASNQSFNNIRKSMPIKSKKLSKDGKVIPKGVRYVPHLSKKNPWYACLQYKYKWHNLGYHSSVEQAENAYLEKRNLILNKKPCVA